MIITVLGCGAWGSTIGKVLAENSHDVTLWCHNQTSYQHLNDKRTHPLYPQMTLPDSLTPSYVLRDALAGADAIVIGVASPFIDIVRQLVDDFSITQPVLSLTKGVLKQDGRFLISDYYADILGSDYPVTYLSGPNLADEIFNQYPAATVVASSEIENAEFWQECLSNHYFRVYTNDDVKGTELGGVLKNIMAIAAGIIHGLNLGTNAAAAMMTRALNEMVRFGRLYGAKESTFLGLSGMGDLITTCCSPLSRNFRVGKAIATASSLDDALAPLNGRIAEGVATCKEVHRLARENNIDMPITAAVFSILYEEADPTQCIHHLMSRSLKAE